MLLAEDLVESEGLSFLEFVVWCSVIGLGKGETLPKMGIVRGIC